MVEFKSFRSGANPGLCLDPREHLQQHRIDALGGHAHQVGLGVAKVNFLAK